MKRTIFLLVLIIFISILSRFYRLSSNPPSLFSDEIDASYQAYVFNNYQTDYYGRKFPIHFKSNSDYRTPALIYAISLSQKIFGINNFSTRFPSAFFGLGITLLFFYLGKITKNAQFGLVLAFFSSLNPWLIHYSRAAFEVTGMLFFILLSICLYLKYLRSKKIFLITFSFISLLIATYFYSTAKLFVVFLGLIYLINGFKYLKKHPPSKLILSLIFLLAISAPMIVSTLKGESGYRFSYISIMSDPTISTTIDHNRYLDIKTDSDQIGIKTPILSKVFHNKWLFLLTKFVDNYFSSFSTNFLFTKGDSNLRHGFKNYGYFYSIEIVFLFIGIFYAIKSKSAIKNKLNILFLLILLFSPVPYALTRDSLGPHATRLILLTIPLIYFISFGFYKIFKNHKILFILSFPVYLFLSMKFFHFYFLNYPHISANSWHAGISKALTSLNSYQHQYQKIYFSDKYEPSLLFYLYQNQIIPSNNPNIYQSMPYINQDFFSGHSPDNHIFFGKLQWSKVADNFSNQPQSLYIVPETELNTVISEIKPFVIKNIFTSQNRYESEPKFVFFIIDEDK